MTDQSFEDYWRTMVPPPQFGTELVELMKAFAHKIWVASRAAARAADTAGSLVDGASLHTDGPWRVELCSESGAMVVHDPYGCTATVHGAYTNPEHLANARLIAAAPEMLSALREVDRAGAFECCCSQEPCCGSCIATIVKEAIALATRGSVV